MPVSRIQEVFEGLRARHRVGIIPYLTTGFPNMDATMELVPRLIQGGADLVELGVPFSDPIADGATIQRTNFEALNQGVTLSSCLSAVGHLRKEGTRAPVVLMGYYNPIFSYGVERFASDANTVGVDGVIVADLPTEEGQLLREACLREGIATIPLLAPTSTRERIAAACSFASGFVYCVSLTGVTGARQTLTYGVDKLVAQVREYTSLPIAVGFGVSQPEHIQAVGEYADAAVVGSALLNALIEASGDNLGHVAQFFLEGLRPGGHVIGREVAK